MSKAELYQNVMSRIAAVKAQGRRPVVVFDLDATLFDVGPRFWRILHEYATQHDEKELDAKLKAFRRNNLPYLMTDILKEMGVEDEGLIERLGPYWFDRFFSDHYQYYDTPVAGGTAFVQHLYENDVFIVYLTGRDAPGMLVGCAESLRRNGFPVGVVNTLMLLKPNFEMPDPDFKDAASAFIDGLGEVIATFDNEPGNCEIFQERWPQAINVFLDTQRASMAELPKAGTPTLKDFDFSEIGLKG